MKTETTNRLTDLLSQIPQNMHSMYQIELIEERDVIVIKHPFWIFFDKKHIREITIEEFTITIKCEYLAIVMYKNRVDAQVILF
jgi:hypothetical protein